MRQRLAVGFIGCLIGVALTGAPGCGARQAAEHARFEREAAAARKAGIPVRPEDLSVPEPPAGTNAAPTWRVLATLLRTKPLTRDDRAALEWPRHGAPVPGVRITQKALERRAAEVALVHEALSRPRCVFHREWAKGIDLPIPELAAMRFAAYATCAVGRSQLAAGKPVAAVGSVASGFEIARELDDEPSTLTGYLVGVSANEIALAGLGEVLRVAGERPGVAGAVLEAVGLHRRAYSPRRALGSDVVLHAAFLEQVRRGGPGYLAMLVPGRGTPKPANRGENWDDVVDGQTASMLVRMRSVIAAADLPYPAARDAVAAACGRRASTGDPSLVLAVVMSIAYPEFPARVAEERALADTVRAAASVLAWKVAHGVPPEQLDQVLPQAPRDPFDLKPLRYRREGAGFAIWSVGVTGGFDGGKPGVPAPAGEVVFRYAGTAGPSASSSIGRTGSR